MKTIVANKYHLPADWMMDKHYVYIGRGSVFGNPIKIGEPCPMCGETHDRGGTLKCYEEHFHYSMNCPVSSGDFEQAVRALRGKTLVCFCKPRACHGDVIKRWLDTEYGDEP